MFICAPRVDQRIFLSQYADADDYCYKKTLWPAKARHCPKIELLFPIARGALDMVLRSKKIISFTTSAVSNQLRTTACMLQLEVDETTYSTLAKAE